MWFLHNPLQDSRVTVLTNEWENLGAHPGLRHLHLGGNFQQGARIPEEWAGIPQLYHLDISNNAFAGVLPQRFSEMRSIRHLDLQYNDV